MTNMRKTIWTILQYIIFLGGGIFLVWWQLKNMTGAERIEFNTAFKNANYWVVLPVVIMSVLSHLSRGMRWKILMQPLGYTPKLKNVFAALMVGYLANSAIPRLGEILKCTLLARYEKLRVDNLVGTILVERTFDLLCYLAFIGITVLIQITVVGNFVKKEFSTIASGAGIYFWITVASGVGFLVLVIYVIKKLMRKYPQNKIFYKINQFFSGIAAGFLAIKNLKQRRAFVLHTLFIWLMYLLQIYVGFSAMQGTTHLSMAAACSVLSLATLAMIATPGGIGSFPIFVMKVLGMYAISTSVGQAFGWLMWGVSTGIIITCGLSALLLLPLMNRKPALPTQEPILQNNITD